MPRVCTICGHPSRKEIEGEIASGVTFRRIAERYGTSPQSLLRHRDAHMLPATAVAHAAVEEARERTVRGELERLFVRVHKLFDACDRWLADPANSGEYDLCPRADEIDVIYSVPLGDDDSPLRVQEKKRLSELVRKIQAHPDKMQVLSVNYKHADPRKLVLETAAQLGRQIELLARLTGELDERPEINILVHPQWIDMRGALLVALQDHPAALEAVQHALTPEG
jgi:hypothetical protein